MTWKQNGILVVLKYLHNFNTEKSNNPFAYITTIITNAFIGYITKQKKHSQIKNELFEARDKFIGYDVSLSEDDRAIDYKSMVK